MDRLADVQELLSKADVVLDGPLKVALHEEAVRIADLSGNIDWQFYTRQELVRAAFAGGDADRMLVELTWCLAKCDEWGGCFNESGLLWGCVFALSYVTGFPQITRAQIESLREDAIRRFRKQGASLRAPYMFAMAQELGMGYPDRATDYRRLWLSSSRDEFSQSEAWELYYDACYHFESGDKDKALALGLPMIDGRHPAPDVSFWMADLLLLELLKRGERKLAVEVHRQACKQCSANPKYISHMGDHLVFAALTGNFTRAIAILDKHLPVALQSPVPSAQFNFLLYAWTAAEHLRAVGCRSPRLHLPAGFPLWREDERYEWGVLAQLFETRVRELESQFNARNGNTRYTTSVADASALRTVVRDWPVPPVSRLPE